MVSMYSRLMIWIKTCGMIIWSMCFLESPSAPSESKWDARVVLNDRLSKNVC